MSRAYRIQVRESVRRTIRGEDRVGTTLELLEILPREAMDGLLRDELVGRGFREEGGALVRRDGGLTIAVDPASGSVEVRSEATEEVELRGERGGWADDDVGVSREKAEEALRKRLVKDLEAKADERAESARRQATDRLEAALGDLRAELDAVVNRVTAEALKRKAAQLGRIKEMTEDPQAGSLTIVVEV
jgi:hypothetical protein